ncbi:MAG: 30S ribosomal protein S20 [Acetivibrionales bacterium]|jgi:small subunit ribosomal protein S20|nr:30S ribosomal protein S20 [Clostridiaceae bacterium]
MPNIKSAIKRVKTTEAKNLQNRIKRSELRTTLRSYREAIEANSPEAKDMLKVSIKKVDQAVAKNLLHKNAASRKKSQLQKAYNAMSAK